MKDAMTYPLLDISEPPSQPYELRVVVYAARGLPVMDLLENMNDPFVVVNLEGKHDDDTQTPLRERQETDTHWRAPVRCRAASTPVKRREHHAHATTTRQPRVLGSDKHLLAAQGKTVIIPGAGCLLRCLTCCCPCLSGDQGTTVCIHPMKAGLRAFSFEW